MYKKFKVLKSGVFLHSITRHMAQIKPLNAVPIGSIIQLTASDARIGTLLHFGQIESVADDAEVTFSGN